MPKEIIEELSRKGIKQTEHSSLDEVIAETDVLYVTRIQVIIYEKNITSSYRERLFIELEKKTTYLSIILSIVSNHSFSHLPILYYLPYLE